MSRIGNPYDNAKAESFMKTLKQEEVDGNACRDADEARREIGAFLEQIYELFTRSLITTTPRRLGFR
jgi:putative transposase